MSVNKCNSSLCDSCHLSACYERRHAKTCNIEKHVVKVTRDSSSLRRDLRRLPATSPAPTCDYRSRRAIGQIGRTPPLNKNALLPTSMRETVCAAHTWWRRASSVGRVVTQFLIHVPSRVPRRVTS